jgi:hypothetical protein
VKPIAVNRFHNAPPAFPRRYDRARQIAPQRKSS